ncbi:MAG: SDR family NAD(P)-dependent oxidoreductase, partial [Rhodospirillales bacterium]|nr:SDR family NAD(P)-dependent oxidoreductase [Rhodospirillales bacterium]
MAMRTYSSILITGASSGIGRALALAYAAPGVRLALAGRNPERTREIAEACRRKGAEISEAIIDVSDEAAMRSWILGEDDTRPLDLIVANAGVSSDTSGGGTPAEKAQRMEDINIGGVRFTIQPIYP